MRKAKKVSSILFIAIETLHIFLTATIVLPARFLALLEPNKDSAIVLFPALRHAPLRPGIWNFFVAHSEPHAKASYAVRVTDYGNYA
jgi:hypothetical protein